MPHASYAPDLFLVFGVFVMCTCSLSAWEHAGFHNESLTTI